MDKVGSQSESMKQPYKTFPNVPILHLSIFLTERGLEI